MRRVRGARAGRSALNGGAMHKQTKLWVAAVAVLLAVYGAWETGVIPSGATTQVVVVEVRGDAEFERAGEREKVVADLVLQESDALVTGEDGEVELRMGASSFLRLASRSRVEVRSVSEDEVDLVLEDGRLEATIRAQDGLVRVENEGRQVEAQDAEFAVGVMNGVFQVSVARGSVETLGASGERVTEGKEARFVDVYAEIGEVPASLLMDVDWEEGARTNKDRKRVHGRTAPGAHVTARGAWGARSVYAREDGFFEIEVPLEEGDNRMDLMAEDALGRQSPVVRVALPHLDTRGPEFEGEVDYGD